MTESALVGCLAGGLALLVSWAFLKISVILVANALPVQEGALVLNVTPDLAIFGYVLVISLIAGIFSGLAPAMESSRTALSSVRPLPQRRVLCHRGSALRYVVLEPVQKPHVPSAY